MVVFITANLGRHVGTKAFRENLNRIHRHAGGGTVIGFQEIDENDGPNEHQIIREAMGKVFDFAGWSTHEPIALGSKWSVRRDNVIKGSTGLARLSPARKITECLAEYDNGAEILFMNLHYPRKDRRLSTRWVALRVAHKRRVNHWTKQGVTVVYNTDANRVKFKPVHRNERVLAHDGLDHIRCVEAPEGARIKVTGGGVIGLSIDGHDAPYVEVSLERGY